MPKALGIISKVRRQEKNSMHFTRTSLFIGSKESKCQVFEMIHYLYMH